MKLCVFEEPHRFVLEIPEQPQLVHEVWIEGETARQHELQKPTLAEGKNTLASYLRLPEHNDLSVSRAIGVWNACYDADQRMRERDRAARRGPCCRVCSLRRCEYRQSLIERRRHDGFWINSVEVVSSRRNTRIARKRKIECVYEHVRTGFAYSRP